MKNIVIASLVVSGVLLPLSAHARAVAETAAIDTRFFDDERIVPWDDVGSEEFAQQTTPAPVVPAVPVLPAAPLTKPVEPVLTPPVVAPTPAEPNPDTPEGALEDDFSIGDIPVVETLELVEDKARKALDVYILVREKYKDAALENFENLQDFVDQSPMGKAFEADVKAAGFTDVTEWNTTITTLSFAYDNSIDDQTGEIKQQITELQADTSMAQDMRERMVSALNAMIPSDNNKKVLDALKANPTYTEKLKLLETEAE